MNMAQPFRTPVLDSVPRVADEVAVGEDLNFQRKWWTFERIIWSFFVLILICDLLGVFGRGWLAKGKLSTPDHALTLDYERVERSATASIMTLHFGAAAVHDGKIQVFVNNEVIRSLGAQRMAPQPARSALTDGGVTYTFDAGSTPTIAEIALQPLFPGRHHILLQVPCSAPIKATIFVLP
jgi:hypothetical protein